MIVPKESEAAQRHIPFRPDTLRLAFWRLYSIIGV